MIKNCKYGGGDKILRLNHTRAKLYEYTTKSPHPMTTQVEKLEKEIADGTRVFTLP
jgi:hypothetical protein